MPDERPLTAATMRLMMAEFSKNIQTNMRTQIHTLSAELRKELHEDGQRTYQDEKKMDEFAKAHNSLADKLQEMEAALQEHKLKLADIEERAWRNNLRIRLSRSSPLHSMLTCWISSRPSLQRSTRTNQSSTGLIDSDAHNTYPPQQPEM
ncbi:Hypothetical predicted protein [Pelobates cultripes]|uniref:Uncharacterized protein n=1 Tax=Pelobates cultripes TaxID=61616 RepID=A0AAD1WZN6_PELCU|nr:Hypothetical predicted protein [Pelobates cultripes]